MSRDRLILFVFLLVFASANAAPARAYEEQATLSLSAGYAAAPYANGHPEAHHHGVVGAIGGTYGLGDAFSLEARLAQSFLVGRSDAPFVATSTATIGFNYAVDILEFVPLFGAGLGAAVGASDGQARGDLVIYGMVGFDYLLSRTSLIGVSARVEALPFRNIPGVDVLALTAELRYARIFDLY